MDISNEFNTYMLLIKIDDLVDKSNECLKILEKTKNNNTPAIIKILTKIEKKLKSFTVRSIKKNTRNVIEMLKDSKKGFKIFDNKLSLRGNESVCNYISKSNSNQHIIDIIKNESSKKNIKNFTNSFGMNKYSISNKFEEKNKDDKDILKFDFDGLLSFDKNHSNYDYGIKESNFNNYLYVFDSIDKCELSPHKKEKSKQNSGISAKNFSTLLKNHDQSSESRIENINFLGVKRLKTSLKIISKEIFENFDAYNHKKRWEIYENLSEKLTFNEKKKSNLKKITIALSIIKSLKEYFENKNSLENEIVRFFL